MTYYVHYLLASESDKSGEVSLKTKNVVGADIKALPTITIPRQCVPAMRRHVAVDDQAFHSGVEPVAISTDVCDLRAFCGLAVCSRQQVSNSWRLGTRQVRWK